MLSIGDVAPDFELADDQGRPRRLSRELALGPVALYFYPADFTPVCTRQACMFRDRGDELARAGVRVLGVSPRGRSAMRRSAGDIAFPSPSWPIRRSW